jgi:hypothetical protein
MPEKSWVNLRGVSTIDPDEPCDEFYSGPGFRHHDTVVLAPKAVLHPDLCGAVLTSPSSPAIPNLALSAKRPAKPQRPFADEII